MLLITTFVELRVIAGRSRTLAGRPHPVSGRPILIHTCHSHAALYRGLEKSLPERHGRGIARVRHGGMFESNTAALCKSNVKDTI
jgi:plasmid stabilization system protein ParE